MQPDPMKAPLDGPEAISTASRSVEPPTPDPMKAPRWIPDAATLTVETLNKAMAAMQEQRQRDWEEQARRSSAWARLNMDWEAMEPMERHLCHMAESGIPMHPREAAAEGLWQHAHPDKFPWQQVMGQVRRQYMDEARASITAYLAAPQIASFDGILPAPPGDLVGALRECRQQARRWRGPHRRSRGQRGRTSAA